MHYVHLLKRLFQVSGILKWKNLDTEICGCINSLRIVGISAWLYTSFRVIFLFNKPVLDSLLYRSRSSISIISSCIVI